MPSLRTITANAEFIYISGGNPPISAGIFLGGLNTPVEKVGDRVAWWPAGYEPTQENLDKVMRLIWARESDDEIIGRQAIRDVLNAA